MVEQIQTPPPYEALVSSGAITPETSKTASNHNTLTNSVTPGKEGDTVTLSASARASQLYLQGHTVTQIASLLGLPPATVESDLNIAPTSATGLSAVLPTTAQSPATQVTPADGATPGHAASSPYTAPTATVEKAS